MDVPEGSKHGKKSTSQKLEDQKKVRKPSLFVFHCFKFSSMISSWWELKKTCCFPTCLYCMSTPSSESLFIGWFVVLFYMNKNVLVRLLLLSEFPLAISLLISIYKGEGGWRWSLSAASLSSQLMWRVTGQSPPKPPPGNTYLLSVWDAFYLNPPGNRRNTLKKWSKLFSAKQ